MATLALIMLGTNLVLTFFIRVIVSLRQTGASGLIGLRPGAGFVESLSGVSFVVGIILGGLSPILVLTDSLETIDALDSDVIQGIGVAIASIAGLAIFLAQLGMGASWRIGVPDADAEQLDLVTTGWFSVVRNPIYTSMIAAWIGFFLMVPTWVGLAAAVLAIVGLEMQVRMVEEPYLLRTHSEAFHAYTARVGRFVPGVGRTSG